MKDHKQIKKLTRSLLEEIGENPKREGLIKTPSRVAKAWDFFSQGYNVNIPDIINDAIFKEDCSEMVVVRVGTFSYGSVHQKGILLFHRVPL